MPMRANVSRTSLPEVTGSRLPRAAWEFTVDQPHFHRLPGLLHHPIRPVAPIAQPDGLGAPEHLLLRCHIAGVDDQIRQEMRLP